MVIHFDLPEELERDLRAEIENLDLAAKEALGVELYRQGKLSHAQLALLLGLTRYETDGVLKRHNVMYDMSLEDVLKDADLSRRARRG